MNEIEIYVHSPKGGEPAMITIESQALVEDVLKKIREAGLCDGPIEELLIFGEDAEEPWEHGRSMEHCGVKHRHHVHCHKCRRIHVAVLYNGVEKAHPFPPSARVKRVLKWAVNEFQLKGADAENKVLRLAEPPETELPNEAHVGSFAHPPKCGVRVCLVPPIRFQG